MSTDKFNSKSFSQADTGEACQSGVYRKREKAYGSPLRSLFWALAFMIMGSLLFAQTQGWMMGDKWFPYFLVGLGAICLMDVLVHYLHPSYRYFSFGRSTAGIILIFIGASMLVGFAPWLPLVLILCGLAIIIRFYARRRDGSISR
jgi:hypothetical protein